MYNQPYNPYQAYNAYNPNIYSDRLAAMQQQFNTTTNTNNNNANPQTNNVQNVNWIQVNGIDGAKDVIVQPNQTSWMMDTNSQKFYIKSSDSLGVSSLKCYQFSEIDLNNQNLKETVAPFDTSCFVTKDEFAALKAKIDTYENFIDNNINKPASINNINKKKGD